MSRLDEEAQNDLLEALAGAVLMRDGLAETGDSEGLIVALQTVAALNRLVDALGADHPVGSAAMVKRDGERATTGWIRQ